VTPEKAVHDAVLDALANEYDWTVVQGWVDDAFADWDDLVAKGKA
jgi:hypothetical protein